MDCCNPWKLVPLLPPFFRWTALSWMITAVSAHSTLLPWRELYDKSRVPIQSLHHIHCLRVEKKNNPLEDAGIFRCIYTWSPNDLYFWRSTPPKTRPKFLLTKKQGPWKGSRILVVWYKAEEMGEPRHINNIIWCTKGIISTYMKSAHAHLCFLNFQPFKSWRIP